MHCLLRPLLPSWQEAIWKLGCFLQWYQPLLLLAYRCKQIIPLPLLLLHVCICCPCSQGCCQPFFWGYSKYCHLIQSWLDDLVLPQQDPMRFAVISSSKHHDVNHLVLFCSSFCLVLSEDLSLSSHGVFLGCEAYGYV